jgi:SagB-type dehydrogenase family enzyme
MPTIPPHLGRQEIVLPTPVLPRATLAEALKRRHSTRTFLSDPLGLDELSALLWSAYGVNRPALGGRTAPSARNRQEIDLYVVLAEGTYHYEARAHRLLLVRGEDLRAATGTQDFPGPAPLNLLYVADFARMAGAEGDDLPVLAAAAAGAIAQNVYLHCATADLGTVVRALVDRKRLAQALRLRPTQRIMLAQTVGIARV